jgi:hypothetical protein
LNIQVKKNFFHNLAKRIHDPKDPYLQDYDEEFVMTVSDWYHDEAKVLIEQLTAPGYGGFSVSFLLLEKKKIFSYLCLQLTLND